MANKNEGFGDIYDDDDIDDGIEEDDLECVEDVAPEKADDAEEAEAPEAEEPELDLSMLTIREKIDAALAKITREAEALKDGDPCKLMISEYIMDKISNGPVAELILAKGRTLSELNKQMWDEAKKKKSGNGAWISDVELMQLTDDYYGLNTRAAFTENVIDITDLL